mgnify:CR=1 FL=1
MAGNTINTIASFIPSAPPTTPHHTAPHTLTDGPPTPPLRRPYDILHDDFRRHPLPRSTTRHSILAQQHDVCEIILHPPPCRQSHCQAFLGVVVIVGVGVGVGIFIHLQLFCNISRHEQYVTRHTYTISIIAIHGYDIIDKDTTENDECRWARWQ